MSSSEQAGRANTRPIPVTADNFTRAESDRAVGGIVKLGGFGKFHHGREFTPLDTQLVL
jgi:hypothetical protein